MKEIVTCHMLEKADRKKHAEEKFLGNSSCPELNMRVIEDKGATLSGSDHRHNPCSSSKYTIKAMEWELNLTKSREFYKASLCTFLNYSGKSREQQQKFY